MPSALYRINYIFEEPTNEKPPRARIRARISLQFENIEANVSSELADRTAQIIHIIKVILRSKQSSDLTTVMHKLNLAEEIRQQINMIVRERKVIEVLFEEVRLLSLK